MRKICLAYPIMIMNKDRKALLAINPNLNKFDSCFCVTANTRTQRMLGYDYIF